MPYGYQPKRFANYRRSNFTRTYTKNTRLGRFRRGATGRFRKAHRKGWSRTFRKWSGYAGTAMKALGLARSVYSLINPEYKFIDNNTNNQVIQNTNTALSLITSIGQGVDENNRTGNSILAKYIHCTFVMRYNNQVVPTLYRITIVTTQDGTPPGAGDIYENTSSGLAVCTSPWKKNSDIRYKVKFDRLFYIDQYRPTTVHRYNIKIRGHHHIKYVGPSPTDTGPGNFWAFTTADQGSASNSIITTRNYRVSYLDN